MVIEFIASDGARPRIPIVVSAASEVSSEVLRILGPAASAAAARPATAEGHSGDYRVVCVPYHPIVCIPGVGTCPEVFLRPCVAGIRFVSGE